MIGIAVVGGLLIGLCALFVLRAYAMPGASSAARLEQIEAYGYRAATAETSALATEEPAFGDAAKGLGRWLIDRSPRIQESSVRMELRQAGMYTMSAATFTGYRVLSSLVFGGGFLLIGLAGRASGALIVVGTPLAAALGFVLPRRIVQERIRKREEEVEHGLPELVDILVVAVESGLALSRALQVAADRVTGALGEELRLTLQEQQMGLSTNDALGHLRQRCDTPSVRSFVRSVTQGESLGVSIGDILRTLAHELRTRRRQSAEAQARKAPVKILFPLVLLIFPAMFVVLLYPAVHGLVHSLGS
jgi:tight adherence protein C